MASRYPDSEEEEAGARPRGVTVEEVEDAVRGAYRSTTFEDSLITLFVSAKEAIALEIGAEKPTSLEKSRFLMSLASSYVTYSTSMMAATGFSLPPAFLSMLTSAMVAAGPNVMGVNFPPSAVEKCSAERAFLAVLTLMARQAEDPESYFENELENAVFELFLSVKAAVEQAAGIEATSAEEEVQDLIRHAIEHDSDAKAFDRAITALVVIVGFLAAEVSPRTSPDVIPQAETNSFCFDLYLYMGFRYHLISREDHERLRSRMVGNHFSSKIGKAVILLSRAYRLKIMENFIGVMSYFKLDLQTCNSLYYITRLVRDSIQAYPTSSYRYLVLLSLISEITLARYHDIKSNDAIGDYLNEACRYYNESGMIEFETLLLNHNNFEGVRKRADPLNKAWSTVSAVAINAEVLRPQSLTELMAQYGDHFQSYRLELGSSRTSQTDEDFEKEALRLDDEDFSNPDAAIDFGRKSPLPEAQLGLDVVEEILNLEGQNDESPTKRSKCPVDFKEKSKPEGQKAASPTKGRKGPADVKGKSKPEGQKVESPTKGCKGSADVKGKFKPEGRNDDSPTKGSKGLSPEEGKSLPIVPSRLRDDSWNLAVPQSPKVKTLVGPAEVVSLVPKGREAASPTKGSQRPADVKERSKPEGQKAASLTKGSQQPPADVKEKSRHEDQKAASPTKGSQRPSPEAGKSSPGALQKSEDVEESITEP